MSRRIRIGSLIFLSGALPFALALSPAIAAAEAENVTLTVTAVAKKDINPAVSRNDVQFFQNKERTQIADWRHGERLYLAVLIDDSLNSTVANQWRDLKDFFSAQPSTTYISVFYARNGSAMLAQDFTNDHALAAKALRLPIGPGALTSPYFAVQDLMKRLPGTPRDRRSVLLISSGIDYFHGNFPTSPDLDTTIEQAQKGNINVWSIYYPDTTRRSHSFFLAARAQSALTRLTEETGAESYYLGTTAPVTFKPYLDKLATHLRNQYLLTFKSSGSAKGGFARVKVAAELPNSKFMSASRAYLHAAN